MKTFNEFINEEHQFLRSISKNDKVKGVLPEELQVGDWFWCVNQIHARHCQITNIKNETKASNGRDAIIFYFNVVENNRCLHYCFSHEYLFKIDEYTSGIPGKWIFTTDEETFINFKEKYFPSLKIDECPAK